MGDVESIGGGSMEEVVEVGLLGAVGFRVSAMEELLH
jgi:hypothetical protein